LTRSFYILRAAIFASKAKAVETFAEAERLLPVAAVRDNRLGSIGGLV
jgi:hypothetical protein